MAYVSAKTAPTSAAIATGSHSRLGSPIPNATVAATRKTTSVTYTSDQPSSLSRIPGELTGDKRAHALDPGAPDFASELRRKSGASSGALRSKQADSRRSEPTSRRPPNADARPAPGRTA